MGIKELRAKVRAALERMEQAHSALSEPAEDADLEALEADFTSAEEEHRTATVALERAVGVKEARDNLPVDPADEGADEDDDTDPDKPRVRVTKEPLTYERGVEGRSFFADLASARYQGDQMAAQRLSRHREEMIVEREGIAERANPNQSAGEGGEFIPPLWLDEWVKLPRAGRAVADTLARKTRPPGTNQINVPKVSTGSTTEVQTDKGSVSSTDITSTSVTAQVQTIAGQQDVSQQLLDLSQPGIDEVIADDLMRAYAAKLDQKVISGSVTNAKGLLQVSGSGAVTFTQATPTAALLYPKIADGVQRIHTGLFEPPQVIAMHPQRWGFLLASLDTTNRPLIVPTAPMNPLAVLENVSSEAVVGQMQGLPVIVDANIPSTEGAGTNQDAILIYRADNIFLYEDEMPTFRTFGEVLSGTLQVRFQAYGYYAIAERLPVGISKIQGTGLVTPSF